MVTENQQQQTTNGSLIEKKDKMQRKPVKKYRQKKQTNKENKHRTRHCAHDTLN